MYDLGVFGLLRSLVIFLASEVFKPSMKQNEVQAHGGSWSSWRELGQMRICVYGSYHVTGFGFCFWLVCF